jgi:FkbM family methyltransferase
MLINERRNSSQNGVAKVVSVVVSPMSFTYSRKNFLRLLDALRALKRILLHPLGRQYRLRTLTRYLRYQIGSRTIRGPIVVPVVSETRLIVRPGIQGGQGAIYVGLIEFGPMGLVLHAMRREDLLIDVGALIGMYTLLAAGGCGANVIAFEPVPAVADRLEENVRLNNFGGFVEVRRSAVGGEAGFVQMSTHRDVNYVVTGRGLTDDSRRVSNVNVPLERLDDVGLSKQPKESRIFLKVDVEGFEVEVLKGAEALLRRDELLAVIIEINGSGKAFGHPDELILERLESAGLTEVTYDPLRRELREQTSPDQTRIFVRDIEEVRRRIETAPRVRLGIGVDI